MARYEIVGLFDCPWYAKADKLADELQLEFSNIEFNKTMKDEFQWKVKAGIPNSLQCIIHSIPSESTFPVPRTLWGR